MDPLKLDTFHTKSDSYWSNKSIHIHPVLLITNSLRLLTKLLFSKTSFYVKKKEERKACWTSIIIFYCDSSFCSKHCNHSLPKWYMILSTNYIVKANKKLLAWVDSIIMQKCRNIHMHIIKKRLWWRASKRNHSCVTKILDLDYCNIHTLP